MGSLSIRSASHCTGKPSPTLRMSGAPLQKRALEGEKGLSMQTGETWEGLRAGLGWGVVVSPCHGWSRPPAVARKGCYRRWLEGEVGWPPVTLGTLAKAFSGPLQVNWSASLSLWGHQTVLLFSGITVSTRKDKGPVMPSHLKSHWKSTFRESFREALGS